MKRLVLCKCIIICIDRVSAVSNNQVLVSKIGPMSVS